MTDQHVRDAEEFYERMKTGQLAGQKRKSIYAVSLVGMMELTRDPTGLPLLMLLNDVVTDKRVEPFPEKAFAHQGLIVREDVDPERWQAIVKLIRSKFRYDQFPIYEKGKRGWKTVRG